MKPPAIYLTGLKNCGKTTLARLCAENTGLPYYDLDNIIQEIGPQKQSCRKLYSRLGAAGFQQIEAQAARQVAALLKKHSKDTQTIVALGGGIVENSAAWEILEQAPGVFIYLQEAEENLFARIVAGGIPPFMDSQNPREAFHTLYSRRSALYEKQCHYKLDITDLSIEKSLAQLLSFLDNY